LPTGGLNLAEQKTHKPATIETVNIGATADDIGSHEHRPAANPDVTDASLRGFGTLAHDLQDLADWFKLHGVTSVAMCPSSYKVGPHNGLSIGGSGAFM